MVRQAVGTAALFVFLGGAVLSFAQSPEATDAARLPGKSDLDVVLMTPFDDRTAATSQALTFKLMREVKKDGAVLVPKDATMAARVTQVQKQLSWLRGTKRTYYLVGLQVLSINIGDKSIPVMANLETVAPSAMNDYFIPLSHGPDKWGEFDQNRFQFKVPPPQPGESFLGIVREGLKLPKGLRLVFRTPES